MPAPELSSSASANETPRAGVLYLIPTLEAGGAERVCLHYVNHATLFRPVLAVQFRRGALLEEVKPGIDIREVRPPRTRSTGEPRRESGLLRRGLVALAEQYLGEDTRRFLQIREKEWNAFVRRLRGGSADRPKAKGSRRRTRAGAWRRPVSLAFLHLPLHILFLLRQARLVAAMAREADCPLVSGFLPFTNGIALFAKIFFNRRLRVVVNVHSVQSRILEGETARERFLIRFLIRRFYPKADRIVAVSDGIRRDLIDRFGVPERKIRVVHNPIDLDRIRRLSLEPVDHEWAYAPRKPLVVAVGRLVAVKGFDLLIRAFAGLRNGHGARLWIIGEGEERRNLEDLVRQFHLEDRVAFLGFRGNPWKYMSRADCLVLSSRVEGSPNVIGEALALGLPVLAADCAPGIGEYLDAGRLGMLVPPEDVRALGSGLETLLADERLRGRLSAGGPEGADPFALSRAVADYEALLTEVARP